LSGNNKVLGLTVLLFGIAVLVGTLLVGQYRGTVAQHQAADKGYLNHANTQAHTLGTFLDRTQYELDELSRRRVVTAYFANKALGITMEYGLRISLLDLAEEMDVRLQRTLTDGHPVFSRMVLVDGQGEVVWDSFFPDQDPGQPWHLVTQNLGPGFGDSPLQFFSDSGAKPQLVMQANCGINDRQVGTLIGFVPLPSVLALFNDSPHADDPKSGLVLGDKPLLEKKQNSGPPSVFTQIVGLKPEPGQILRAEVKSASGDYHPVLAACSKVDNLPLCVIRIAPVPDAAAWAGPRRVLINLVVALFAVVMGTLMFAHSKAREVDLSGKLAAETDRSSVFSSKNQELAREIARREEVEKIMQEAVDNAEAANRAKGQFLANMSHEIRTPLNGILGLTELVLDTDLDPDQQEHLAIALDSGKSLLGIINDILDISRIEAGRIQIETVTFNLAEHLASIVQSFRAAVADKDIDFDLELDPGLPLLLVSDEVRVRQVLVNLVGNAIKFTNQGKVTLAASLHSPNSQENLVRFQVHDTGIGIDRDKLDSIFDSFCQGDGSTTRLYGGSGLGLTISHHLAQLMQGSLEVESSLGQGSTFTFYIPLVLPEKGEVQPKAHSDLQNMEPGRSLKILVAEDNPVNQFYMKNLLKTMGHTFSLASDGHQALELLENEVFDLGLIDIQMPHMDGLQATRVWRKKEALEGRDPLPLIALTAFAMPQDRKRCLEAGMNDYLTKPVDRERLNQILAQYDCPQKTSL